MGWSASAEYGTGGQFVYFHNDNEEYVRFTIREGFDGWRWLDVSVGIDERHFMEVSMPFIEDNHGRDSHTMNVFIGWLRDVIATFYGYKRTSEHIFGASTTRPEEGPASGTSGSETVSGS